MNELLQQLKSRWQALEPRERMTVSVGGLVLGVILLVGLVIVPSINSYQKLKRSVPTLRSQLETMNAQMLEARRLRGKQRTRSAGGSLLSVLEQSSQQHDIKSAITSLTPRPNNAAAVILKGIEFNKLVKWLAGLASQNGLRVTEANIKKTDTSGVVDVQVIIRESQ